MPLFPLLLALTAQAAEPDVAQLVARYRAGSDQTLRYSDWRGHAKDAQPIPLCEDLVGEMKSFEPSKNTKELLNQGLSSVFDPAIFQHILILVDPSKKRVSLPPGGPLPSPLKDNIPLSADGFTFVQNVFHFNESRRKEFDEWTDHILVPAARNLPDLEAEAAAATCDQDPRRLRESLGRKITTFERLSGRASQHRFYDSQLWYVPEVELRNYVNKYLQDPSRKWFKGGSMCGKVDEQARGIVDGYADQLEALDGIVSWLNEAADRLKAAGEKLEAACP